MIDALTKGNTGSNYVKESKEPSILLSIHCPGALNSSPYRPAPKNKALWLLTRAPSACPMLAKISVSKKLIGMLLGQLYIGYIV